MSRDARSLEFVESIRLHELARAVARMPAGSRILEIGAGVGWQARELHRLGFMVEAIDLPDGTYAREKSWPITDYDGVRIPFPDRSFDVVFSSNVLEHIPHLEGFQAEIHRVLRDSGLAIHGLPTSSWRIWTIISHYPFVVREVFRKLFPGRRSGQSVNGHGERKSRHGASMLRRILFAMRHGESGNVLTEIYYFSCRRWRVHFSRCRWQVREIFSNELFYTGYLVFGRLLSIGARRRLSHVLGGSCRFYVLSKRPGAQLERN